MEKYVQQTELVLGILQEKMPEESFQKSCDAGEKMYKAIGAIAEEADLNIHELWNAVMTIHLGVTELAIESAEGK